LKFIFDLDGTITRQETLPMIAERFCLDSEIGPLTDATIKGNVPFIESFINRVRILGKIEVSEISKLLANIALNEEILEFIKENVDQCVVATGNFEGWIQKVAERIPCQIIASEGYEHEQEGVKLTKILMKEELVKKYKEEGEFVVYIGDGHNDAEAMRLSDIAIACGIVHEPANSVIQNCDYAIYESSALLRLLNQIRAPQPGRSVVISAAGVGSRLGMGQTKSLIEIEGKSLIEHQLDWFKQVEDVRVVVGFQAQKLIQEILKIRKDVVFAFNHNYFHTKTGTSLYLGSRHANEWIVSWDGDLLINPNEVRDCIESDEEYIGISSRSTEDGVFVELDNRDMVVGFTRNKKPYEWSGPAVLKKSRINGPAEHVYTILQPLLPVKSKLVNALDIDTYSDYANAIEFVKSWNHGNSKIHSYYKKMEQGIKNPEEIRNKAHDFSEFDIALVKKYASKNQTLLDLGSGTGLLINSLTEDFKKILAVEKYEGLAKFINRSKNIRILICDLLEMQITEKFDLITIFGVMNFFDKAQALKIYKQARQAIKKSGKLIVKHQMGVSEDVLVDGFSAELTETYYSEYREQSNEIKLISEAGFRVDQVIDIYPAKFNRWSNTHFYALVCHPI